MDQQRSSYRLRIFIVVAFSLVLISGVALLSYWCGMKSISKPGQTQTAVSKNAADNAKSKVVSSLSATSNQLLSVTAPIVSQTISTPVRVAGKSNFFEAHTSIRVKDANGNILAQSFATAAGWMDKLFPFATYVSYSKPATATGTVEVYEASAQNGQDTNLISIPVKFADISSKDWSKFSPKFENALVNGIKQEIGAELATNINFIIDATECCGSTTKNKALPQVANYLQNSGLINFSQDTEQVKKLRTGTDAQYLSKYIIGISKNNYVVGYHVGLGGKVDDIFYSVSIISQ